ncbi:hypothetical protein [Lactiplantibacillus pentosus]|nr:hypothetical protein [Lactiplantibacillus pentosus]
MWLYYEPVPRVLKLKSIPSGFKVDRLIITDWEDDNWNDYLEEA